MAAPLRSPGFLVPSLCVLAIGIGAAISAFSLIERSFWRPLPGVLEGERLVSIEYHTPSGNVPVSSAVLDDLDRGLQSLESLFSFTSTGVNLSVGNAPPRRAICNLVTAGFFEGVGAAIATGRDFSAEESEQAGEPVAMISHRLWQEAFSGSADVLGRPVYVNGHRASIVGVAVEGFSGVSVLSKADLWLPVVQMPMALPFVESFDPKSRSFYTLYARLTEGSSAPAAAAELQGTAAGVGEAMGYQDLKALLTEDAGRPAFLGEYLQALLKPITAVSILFLVAAVANLGSLFLARGLSRRHESGVRQALGASRQRLCADAMIEGLFVAALGTVAALLVTAGLFALFDKMGLLGAVPGFDGFTLSGSLLMAAGASAVLCGLAGGAATAWSSTKGMSLRLKESSYSLTRPARVRSLLAVVQIGSAFALVVAAGGFHLTMKRLLAIDLGMNLRGLYVFSIQPELNRYDPDQTRRLYRELMTGLTSRPEITGSALVQIAPFVGTRRPIKVRPLGEEGEWQDAFRNRASSGYFEQIGVPLIEGQDFRSVLGEPRLGRRSAVISRSLAQRLWPSGGGVGRTLKIKGGGEVRVRGIVDDHRAFSPFHSDPFLFEALGQGFLPGRMSVVFRGPGSPGEAAQIARAEVAGRDPKLAVFGVRALRAGLDGVFLDRRLLATLSILLAVGAILLSSVGLYGTLSWNVLQRRREFGIRLAMGSKRNQIALLGLRYVSALMVAGVIGGGLLVRLASQWIEARLYRGSAFELEAVLMAAAVVALCSLGAAVIPMTRALSVDPASVLRAE